MITRPEILAPAGSRQSFIAAVNAGCDAVYTGGLKFGARASASNFETDELIELIDYAHIHNVSVYLTTNTLIKNNELFNEYYEYLLPLYKAGLDAVIVQDIGLMEYVHTIFPDIDIHVSTQATVCNSSYGNYLKKYGITRIVPPRELSLAEISSLKKETNLEIEVFTHGALCYCYSGQCLMSSLNGGRSGNRGRCAQPCRKKYSYNDKGGYILSPKDICTLKSLPGLIDADVDSFKIEGRMKKPEYVALAVMMYKKYRDMYIEYGLDYYNNYIESDNFSNDFNMLTDIYNRGGYCDGYIHKYNGKSMMCTDRPNHFGTHIGNVVKSTNSNCDIKLIEDVYDHDVLEIRSESGSSTYEFTTKSCSLKGSIISTNLLKNLKIIKGQKVYRIRNNNLINRLCEYQETTIKRPVTIRLTGHLGEPLYIEMSLSESTNEVAKVSCNGEIVEQASNAPVTVDRIEKQLGKLGNTDFTAKNIYVDIDNNIFVPMTAINNLRRACCDKLRQLITSSYKRHDLGVKYEKKRTVSNRPLVKPTYIAAFNNNHQIYNQLLKSDIFDSIVVNINFHDEHITDIIKEILSVKKTPIISLPEIMRNDDMKRIGEILAYILIKYPDISFIVNNMEEALLLNSINVSKANIISGPSMYAFNDMSLSNLDDVSDIHFAPYELCFDELDSFNKRHDIIQIYGAIPVMTSVQCVKKTTASCTKNNECVEFSNKDNAYVSQCICRYCHNIIYSKYPINYINDIKKYNNCNRYDYFFNFTYESINDYNKIIKMINSPNDNVNIKNEAGYIDKGVY